MEPGEEIAAWVSFKNLAPNLVEPVTAESGAADCGGVFACLIEGFEDVIQLLQARVKHAKNALAECSDRAVFVNVPLDPASTLPEFVWGGLRGRYGFASLQNVRRGQRPRGGRPGERGPPARGFPQW